MVRRLVERGGRYSLVGAVCVLLNYAIIVATNAAGLHYLAAMMVAFALVTPIGFLLHSRFTFHEPLRWPAFWRATGKCWTWSAITGARTRSSSSRSAPPAAWVSARSSKGPGFCYSMAAT